MSIPGRIDKHKRFKRSQNDIDDFYNTWGDEVVKELNTTSLLQLSKIHKDFKEEVNTIKTSYNLLLSSSASCGAPNITIHSSINENVDTNLKCANKCQCADKDLSWETLRNLVIAKCHDEKEYRNETYQNEMKNMLISEFFPAVMEDNLLSSLKNKINTENNYALFIATKYQEICRLYISQAKQSVCDKRVLETTVKQDPVLCLYPITFPCQWALDFCNIVEVPSFITERGKILQYMKSNTGGLENKLYTSIYGTEIMEQSNVRQQRKTTSVHKAYALDLPYHMCRFLAIFGSALFLPDVSDRRQYPEMERFTDTQLLVHFAIKYVDEDYYNEFLKDELHFFKTKRSVVVSALNKAINLLLQTDDIKDTKFNVNKEGNVKIYKIVQKSDGTNNTKTEGTVQEIKKAVIDVPYEVMKVLRTFILPNTEEYRKERTLSTVIGKLNNFKQKYALWISSPIGKILNFDKQAQRDFSTLENDLQGEIAIHRYLNSKTAFLPCVTNMYTLLLQAAYGIREVCDPVDLKTNVALIVDEIIINGDDIGYPMQICYLSVFEAFPGLFYSSALSQTLQDFHNNKEIPSNDDQLVIFRLFENYVSFIPKIRLSTKDTSKLFMSELIHPSDIRWVNAEKLIYILGTCKKEVLQVRCNLINTKKLKHAFESNDSQWKYFTCPISANNILKTNLDLEKSYYSPNWKSSLGAFFRAPITMGLKLTRLEKTSDRILF